MSAGELPPLAACWPETATVEISTANRTQARDRFILQLRWGGGRLDSAVLSSVLPILDRRTFSALLFEADPAIYLDPEHPVYCGPYL
jgi:hypothetical protein